VADDSPREKQPNQPQEVQCEAKPFARGDRRGVLITSMPSEANTSSKLAVNFASRSRIKNRNDRACSVRSPARLRATWVTNEPVG
jgi:hypothetical protein